MLRLAFEPLDLSVTVDTQEIDRPGATYTIDKMCIRDSFYNRAFFNKPISLHAYSVPDFFKTDNLRLLANTENASSFIPRWLHHSGALYLSLIHIWNPLLGSADYKLAHHCKNGRTVYSFCMCPGGTVVAAASEPGRLCLLYTSSPICGMHRIPPPPSVPRPSVQVKPVCWAVWLPCGAGARNGKRLANRSTNPTWFAVPFRFAG